MKHGTGEMTRMTLQILLAFVRIKEKERERGKVGTLIGWRSRMATARLFLPLPNVSLSAFLFNGVGQRGFLLLPTRLKRFPARAVKEDMKGVDGPTSTPSTPSSSADDVTKKYGLEAGLWNIFSSKDEGGGGEGERKKSKTDEAKVLLAKYGGAYLATSITLSLISFSLCYVLINAGVDVQDLLLKVGISVDETGGKVGTFALAYAAHKAASPIRFPPTVALTPIVAEWIGKKVDQQE